MTHIIVFVIGGPRGTAVPYKDEIFDRQYIKALTHNRTRILIPEYLRTANRSRYPGSDLSAAAEEIVAFMDALYKYYPRASISVVANSAGTLVTLAALERRAFRAALISPPIASLERIATGSEATDIPAEAKTRSERFFTTDANGIPRAVTATALDQVRAFAGDRFGWNLTDYFLRLTPARRRCVGIVMGDRDARVGLSALPAFRRAMPNVPVKMITGLPHSPETSEQSQAVIKAAAAIDLSRCR